MLEFLVPGYHITELLYAGTSATLYRGYRHHDRVPVLLQVFHGDDCCPALIERCQQTAESLQRLAIAGLPSIIDVSYEQNTPIWILADFGGQPWSTLQTTDALDVATILQIAIATVEALIPLHAAQWIHQQIQPGHILVHPTTYQVKLWLPLLSDQRSPTLPPELMVPEFLAYMSPEQTGRMARQVIDYRSDFYSLGVTLYQACLGHLPFETADLNQLVHSHIARYPISPSTLDDRIPVAFSAVLLKLLQKNPEARYQSGFGLLADLRCCLAGLDQPQLLQNFLVGETDVASELRLVQSLYGRQAELAQLQQVYEAVAQQRSPQVLLIQGASGIGKSLLLNTFQQLVAPQAGYWLVGRCDHSRQEVPYLSLLQALQSLIQQWLSESEEQIARWRQRLQASLAPHLPLLVNLLPQMALIVGPQPALRRSSSLAAHHRVAEAVQGLIAVLVQHQAPLVLVLDQIQWLDCASAELLDRLLQQEIAQPLYVIATERLDAETAVTEPIARFHALVDRVIRLAGFDLDLMRQLVADVVQLPPTDDRVEPLATLIFHRTQGNPFFAHQLLEFLYQQHWLWFDFEQGEWTWDLLQIQALGVTETIVTLMAQKICSLSPLAQQALKVAACIGEQFDLATITELLQQPGECVAQSLDEAVREGLLLQLDREYRLMGNDQHQGDDRFQFLHERLQQAAYQLLSLTEQQHWHLQVGQQSLLKMLQQHRDDQLFEVVNQLNLGQALIADPGERQQLAHLNANAGAKAKQAAAYHSALQYFNNSLALLPDDAWTLDYQFTRQLWLLQAECHYLCGNFAAAAAAFDHLRQQSRTPLEQTDVAAVQITCYINQNRHQEAVQLAIAGLAALDITVPPAIGAETALALIHQIQAQVQVRSPMYLLVLPTASDPVHKQTMILLRHLATATITYDRHCYCWAIAKMVEQSLNHGNTPESAYAYVAFGTILCHDHNEVELGHQLGQVALEVSDGFNTLQGITQFSYGGLLAHWRISFRECRQHLAKALQHCQLTGELLYALYTTVLNTDLALISGLPLEAVQAEIEKFIVFASQRQHRSISLDAKIKQQFVYSLRGQTEDAASFSSATCTEASLLQELHQPTTPKTTLSRYYIYKAANLYLFGYDQQALAMLVQSGTVIAAHFGPVIVVEHYFYLGLTLAACYDQVDRTTQLDYLTQIDGILQRFQLWRQHCPANFAARWNLLQAERQRLLGQDPTCYYDEAIAAAQQQQMPNLSAIANELAGRYYWQMDCQRIAYAYINDACLAYHQWGALAKVTALQQQYQSLLLRHQPQQNWTASPTPSSWQKRLPTLDWMTVLKASQALSGEIVYSKLLEKLLTIVMENAGAQQGVVLARGEATTTEGDWRIEAAAKVTDGAIATTFEPTPHLTPESLPLNLITYAERTGEIVLLHQASLDPRFAHDPYIHQQQLQSALCLPIVHQGESIGLLYLENRLVAGAFTQCQLEVLKLLTTQVAISIANARLYQDLQAYSAGLEAKNQALRESQIALTERTTELNAALQAHQEIQAQLLQTEKMSSLGQLVAGVAHEVKNPLHFILGNLDYANRYVAQLFQLLQDYQTAYPQPVASLQRQLDQMDLAFVAEDLPKLLASMAMGAERIQSIVNSLQGFSRMDAVAKAPANLHDGIDGTLLILKQRLSSTQFRPAIQVQRCYGDLPLVNCFGGQINQVVMNLVANAIDAIDSVAEQRSFEANEDNLGQIIITTTRQTDGATDVVIIQITDNGAGMSDAVMRQIFDAFFTTKPVGKGTGLGLSISYKIITENHGGRLTCESQPGKGTTFTITLPIGGDEIESD